MLLELDDGLIMEFEKYKSIFLQKEPKMKASTKDLRKVGMTDNTVFVAHMLGIYKASIEMGLV